MPCPLGYPRTQSGLTCLFPDGDPVPSLLSLVIVLSPEIKIFLACTHFFSKEGFPILKEFFSRQEKAFSQDSSSNSPPARTHKPINLPPYPCKICASHQLPNQIHFHRDCPLKNNTHPKRINPVHVVRAMTIKGSLVDMASAREIQDKLTNDTQTFTMTTQLSLHYIIENENFSIEDQDNFDNQTDEVEPGLFEDTIYNMASFRAFFGCIYILTFVIGLFGNVLVCCVVFRNKHMQTVTNYFITNLALSDILLCTFAVPFTPLYIFLQEWVFGAFVCKAVPYAQAMAAALQKIGMDPEQQLHTPKIVVIAAAVMEMHGDI
ncbi:PRLHR [Cordylochernes scorpioides]|uniref:PRLHR n=1 Tax=Cordylochernes scorpioides TaxID=51811 RepID=A0ABY6KXP5_9ARAC|nr:PRLHR [Cordylochernes scorpioides]